MFLSWILSGIEWNIRYRRYSSSWQAGTANTQPLGTASLCVCLSQCFIEIHRNIGLAHAHASRTEHFEYIYIYEKYIEWSGSVELLTRQCKCRNVIDNLFLVLFYFILFFFKFLFFYIFTLLLYFISFFQLGIVTLNIPNFEDSLAFISLYYDSFTFFLYSPLSIALTFRTLSLHSLTFFYLHVSVKNSSPMLDINL